MKKSRAVPDLAVTIQDLSHRIHTFKHKTVDQLSKEEQLAILTKRGIPIQFGEQDNMVYAATQYPFRIGKHNDNGEFFVIEINYPDSKERMFDIFTAKFRAAKGVN